MDERKKLLEMYSKQLSEGNPLAEDFVTSKKPLSQAFDARNLAEEALANEVLKNTGIPVPNASAPRLKQEDFLNRIMKERYPELEPNVQLNNFLGGQGMDGAYMPKESKILLDAKNTDPTKRVSGLLHEAGHQYDDKILKFDGTDDVKFKDLSKNVPAGRSLKDLDPMQMNELLNKGHHARIPNLRDSDSYGLGALKSMLKSGTFKSMAGALPVVGGLAAAGMSGDASAAVPLLDEADDIGESKDDEMSLIGETQGHKNYQSSPARMDALKKMRGQ